MRNLLVSEGDSIQLRSILRPPAGSFVRFRPHDHHFMEVAARQVCELSKFEFIGIQNVLPALEFDGEIISTTLLARHGYRRGAQYVRGHRLYWSLFVVHQLDS